MKLIQLSTFYAFETDALSTTQQRGIIVCIPKENKSKLDIENWRPITLLDTVY